MERKTARISKEPEVRRQEILDTAMSVFMEKGYEAATMRDIAAAMHVVPGLCYRYFESKQMLYDTAIEQYVKDITHPMIERLKEKDDSLDGFLDKMEQLVQRIFDEVRIHPEVAPDLQKMMDYYLPTTSKLLEAYRELDKQPVAGDNIRSTKAEIEQTVDTLNVAFEKLLDSLFVDRAWDISSDISVLNTMLAQEGLKEDDFTLNNK